MYEKSWQKLQKLEALRAVEGIYGDETLRRKDNPEYTRKPFASLLRERKKELKKSVGDAATVYPFELDFILNVLETNQAVIVYQLEMMDNLNQLDEYPWERILLWRKELEFDVSSIVFNSINETILKYYLSNWRGGWIEFLKILQNLIQMWNEFKVTISKSTKI